MTAQPLWFVGNRNPSITETIVDADGNAIDIHTATNLQFRMRAPGSSTLKVDAAATNLDDGSVNLRGHVRYDWQAADVDTANQYLVWWVITWPGGKTQDVSEALIEIRPHTGQTPQVYAELEQVKSALQLTGQSYADQDIKLAVSAASRGIDLACHRRFYLDADANQVRYYSPTSYRRLPLDDLAVLTSVTIDRAGSGSYTETWTNGTDFVLEPFNAVADYRPYEHLVVRALAGRWLPFWVEKSVKVTGQFGWTVLPDNVKAATEILAGKLLRRVREAPFGIVTVGIDQGAAMRIAKTDPDVYSLISDLARPQPFDC